MERRARRWRLPLAARIAAVPALIAVAGALAFGFGQSDAAPAPAAAVNKNQTGYRLPVFGGADIANLPRGRGLQVSFDVGFACNGSTCRVPSGKIEVLLRKESESFGYWQGEVSLTGQWTYEHSGSVIAVAHSTPITIPADKLQPGKYVIHHYYVGDQFFDRVEQPQSVDPVLTVNDRYRSSFQVTTTPNPSRAGEEVELSAGYNGSDAPGGLKPTGNIFFLKNGILFNSGKLADGKLTVKTTKLPTGSSAISARYLGDDEFLNSDNPGPSQTVRDLIETTTTLTVSKTHLVSGESTHFTAKVKAKTGNAVPTGSATVLSELGAGGFGQLTNGVLEFDSAVPPGEHSYSASYEPTGDFAPSKSAAVKVTVVKADPITTVIAKPDAAGPGKPVTLSVKVGPPPGLTGFPGGTVTFTDGDLNLGDCELENNFACEITTDKLPLGKRTVTAAYSGDDENNPSTGTATVRVFEGSTTKLTAAPNTATVGSVVVLNAQVAGADPKIAAPLGGKVTFLDGSTELGKGDVDKDGKATFSTTGLVVWTHGVTARFEGSDALDPSTSEKVSVQVNAAGTAPGQGGSSGGGSTGGAGGAGGAGGSTPQPKNLASTGADIGQPIAIGAGLLIMGAVAITFGRKRRRTRSSR